MRTIGLTLPHRYESVKAKPSRVSAMGPEALKTWFPNRPDQNAPATLAEKSTERRNVPVTLPKLKFMQD